jgi:hypothetical protein
MRSTFIDFLLIEIIRNNILKKTYDNEKNQLSMIYKMPRFIQISQRLFNTKWIKDMYIIGKRIVITQHLGEEGMMQNDKKIFLDFTTTKEAEQNFKLIAEQLK